MKSTKNLVIFANHNNGYNITKYLLTQENANILLLVVYEDSNKQWWKSVKKLAIANEIKYIIFEKNKNILHDKLKNLDIDLLLSIGWRNKIPENILSLPKIGSINFHNSLLPKHRGVYANTWPIMLGEEYAGVSIHWITKDMDAGDIISQKKFKIYNWQTAKDVWEKMNKYYLELFKKSWDKVDQWMEISKPQKGKSSYHSFKDFNETNEIDLNKKISVKDFINFLRSKTFEPYYKNAYFIDPDTKKKIYISINLEIGEKKDE